MNISQIIYNLITINKLHPHELAETVKVDTDTVFKWLNNEPPQANAMIELYKNFGVTPNELLGIGETRYNHILKTSITALYQKANEQERQREYIKLLNAFTDNTNFELFLSFIKSNFSYLIGSIIDFYAYFDCPYPSKEDLTNIVLNTVNVDKFTDQEQNKKIRFIIEREISKLF